MARCLALVVAAMVLGCGPSNSRECSIEDADLLTDPLHCGACDNPCAANEACIEGRCVVGCQPGEVETCYEGKPGTLGVGPCVAGMRSCDASGAWSACLGQVVPTAELCTDGIDNNCNGAIDEDVDEDGDGYTTCGGDCCDSTECPRPEFVNEDAFDVPGNQLDDDCNGVVDDLVLLCDASIASNTTDAMDFARSIDICQTATEDGHGWGVIEGVLTRAATPEPPDPDGHAVRPSFGTGVLPQRGVNLAILSTGAAAAIGDAEPVYRPFVDGHRHEPGVGSLPADFLAANNGHLPDAPGCPRATFVSAFDPVMLTLRIRVPSNAQSFALSINFFSSEFAEWTCSVYNDFFVVLLDSAYDGPNPNPPDKNLAFYQRDSAAKKVPVGVNLAHGNTGLFTQCVNGSTGCAVGANPGTITSCTSIDQLLHTGFDTPANGSCDPSSLLGGATGWLSVTGNVVPGEIITLRIGIWDSNDHGYDSLVVVDGFAWSTERAQPGTVIF
ncbi:MAG: MopE-related protein [Kofleriaceae bacterium]